MYRSARALVAALVVISGVAACTGDDDASTPTTEATPSTVEITGTTGHAGVP